MDNNKGNKMELLATVVINNYIRSVEITGKQKPKYYKKGESLPTKYSSKIGSEYQWIKFTDGTFLCNIDDSPVIKNETQVGKPKMKIIKGQELHMLTLRDYERSKIIKAIKAQIIPEVEKLEPITKFPIRILMELYDTILDYEYLSKDGSPRDSTSWDLDNRSLFFSKTFPDVLQGCIEINKDKKLVPTTKAIIPNDSILYITQSPVPIFCPIEDTKDRKLVFKIYHDDRECILIDKDYVRRN